MADCDGSVGVEKQHCLRLSYDIASSYNDAFLAGNFNSGFLDKLHNACGSTGEKIVIANHDFTHICRGESINILFFGDGVYNLFFVYVGG